MGKADTCKYAPSPFESGQPNSAPRPTADSHRAASASASGNTRPYRQAEVGNAADIARAPPLQDERSSLGMSLGSRVRPGTSGSSADVPPQCPFGTNPTTTAATDISQILLRGSGFKTHYHGPSHYASILQRFDELSTAGKNLMKQFVGSMSEGRVVKRRIKAAKKQAKADLVTFSAEHEDMLSMIPTRAVCDPLVDKYTMACESIYRILHLPSFCKEYDAFWYNPRASPTSFVVILLLTLACVHCIEPLGDDLPDSRTSVTRQQAVQWVSVCDTWLRAQSFKHFTLVTWQVRLLLYWAKRVNSIKIKQAYVSVGELVRLAMATGLHREPSLTSERISIFDQEMRRRLWATVLEFELLAATDIGLSPSIDFDGWDCRPPSNIGENEFHEGCEYLPDPLAPDDYGQTSFLCICSQTAALRIEVLGAVNHINRNRLQSAIEHYDAKLRRAIANIPVWATASDESILAHSLAKLQLLELLLLIHQPMATSTSNADQSFFSRCAFRDAAASTLEIYRSLTQPQAFMSYFTCNDLFRAGLSMCYELCHDSASGSSVTFNRERSVELLEYACQIQEDAMRRLGEGFFQFWITVTGLSLVYTKRGMAVEEWQFARSAAQRILDVTGAMVGLRNPASNGLPQTSLGAAGPDSNTYNTLAATRDLTIPNDTLFNLDDSNIPDFWAFDGLLNFDAF